MGAVIKQKSGIVYSELTFFGNKYAVAECLETYVSLESGGGVLVKTDLRGGWRTFVMAKDIKDAYVLRDRIWQVAGIIKKAEMRSGGGAFVAGEQFLIGSWDTHTSRDAEELHRVIVEELLNI